MYEQGRSENHSHQEICGGTGEGDQHALPSRLGEELVGVALPLFGGIVTGHADIAAQRQDAQAIVGGPAAPTGDPGTEADGENLDAHAKGAGNNEMAPFMNQDHHAQPDDYRNDAG